MPEPPVPVSRLGDVPTQQILSFVTHDIYGPASMLRTYLHAVGESTQDQELREMIVDAERLSGQVEGMLRFLQVAMRVATDTLEVELTPVAVSCFLDDWGVGNETVTRDDRRCLDETVTVLADPRMLAMALEGAVWQMNRMGSRQGPVAIGLLESDDPVVVSIGVWRQDGELEGEVLERAFRAADDDWISFLRRLPACGFPLRMGMVLLGAMGGKVEVRTEASTLVMSFPLRGGAP